MGSDSSTRGHAWVVREAEEWLVPPLRLAYSRKPQLPCDSGLTRMTILPSFFGFLTVIFTSSPVIDRVIV